MAAAMHMAGITAHPTGDCVTHQARTVLMDLGKRDTTQFRLLIRDREFASAFDAVISGVNIRIIRTPVGHRVPM